MIEERRLNNKELARLFIEAPDTETRNLNRILWAMNMSAYDFFDKYALEHYGLIIDGRPVYMVALVKNIDGRNELYTIVNSNVEQQFSLFKYCKRGLKGWLDKYKEIWATMENINKKNIEWSKRLGFKKMNEDDRIIILKLEA